MKQVGGHYPDKQTQSKVISKRHNAVKEGTLML